MKSSLFVVRVLVCLRGLAVARFDANPTGEVWWWGEDFTNYNPRTRNSQPESLATLGEVPDSARAGDRYVPRCRNSRLGYPTVANDQFRRVPRQLLWRRGLLLNVSCPKGALPEEEWKAMARRQERLRTEAVAVRDSRLRAQRRDGGQRRQTPALSWLELKRFKQASGGATATPTPSIVHQSSIIINDHHSPSLSSSAVSMSHILSLVIVVVLSRPLRDGLLLE